MRNAGLEEAQAGIKIARRNINNLRYADDTTLMADSEDELASLLVYLFSKHRNYTGAISVNTALFLHSFHINIRRRLMLEKTLESPLDCKEIQPDNPRGNQPWIFIGRTDAEAETPKLWPPDAKSWLIGKDPDAGKDWRQAEKGMTEDGMVGWNHRLNGHEFEQTPGDGERQGGLACYRPWGLK